MHLFHTFFHPLNFRFAHRCEKARLSIGDRTLEWSVTAVEGIQQVQVHSAELWPQDFRCEQLALPDADDSGLQTGSRLEISADAGMQLRSPQGRVLLQAGAGTWFGISGRSWLFQFQLHPRMQFFGLGEKHVPFERSNRAFHFRNTDVWADHPISRVEAGDYDPDYISVPYLIIKQENTYLGLLIDNPGRSLVSISPEAEQSRQLRIDLDYPPTVVLGAASGPASLYIIYGSSLPELTRRFQQLVGTTPLPPIWALGYHQCRWGYRGEKDLVKLAEGFVRHKFPADGLWLDIDYMDGYRVFTCNRRDLPRPAATTAALHAGGFRVVPILDPGVKKEKGYAVYDSGKSEDIFCLNPAGTEFTGMVWPGFTVFPDFSLPEARRWWGRHVKRLAAEGFDGFWLDMNEPSTGPVDDQSMRFQRGLAPHDAFHNQYALLMARATRRALLEAEPDRRPFLLSRAGCTGSQKYAAHWTGDNFSSYRHLRRAIGKSLNLALSGVPFNGPDVGGFGGDCGEALMVDWVKAGFLFPFFRNHTMRESRAQEPWAYSLRALRIIRHYVRLRYTLLPYLYNLFVEQEKNGEAILRPLFYDFFDSPSGELAAIDDQFLVGSAILQAPFLHERARQRQLLLPPGCRWLRAESGRWLEGGRHLTVRKDPQKTPLFLREGSLIPFQPGVRTDNRTDLRRIGLLCCLPRDFRGTARYRYHADDGQSFEYRKGIRTELEIEARIEDRRLHLRLHPVAEGFGPVSVEPFTIHRFDGLRLQTRHEIQTLSPQRELLQLTGMPFPVYRWQSSTAD
jgi:alpha-glucosidase